MLVVQYAANQCLPILEPYHIPLEDFGRTIPILIPLIYIVESVPETLLFGSPSFKLRLRTRQLFLLLAPCNARYDGIGSVCHDSPPFLDRQGGGLSNNDARKSKHRTHPFLVLLLSVRTPLLFSHFKLLNGSFSTTAIGFLINGRMARNLEDKVSSQDKLSRGVLRVE